MLYFLLITMGINDLVASTFSGFPRSQHIIAKAAYVVIIFGEKLNMI